MNRMWKAGLAIVATVALAATAVGFVAAQEGSGVPGGERINNFIERLAGNLGITQDELEAAIDTTQLELIDEAVANGNLTDEQATSARDRVESGEGPGFGFKGRGHGLQRGHQAKAEVAEFIGVTQEELRAAVSEGQSLAQVAEANGVTTADLSAFLLDKITECINDALAAGRIDQAKADEKLADAPAKVDEMINRVGSPEGFGGGRFHGGFGGGFPNGDVTETVAPTF